MALKIVHTAAVNGKQLFPPSFGLNPKCLQRLAPPLVMRRWTSSQTHWHRFLPGLNICRLSSTNSPKPAAFSAVQHTSRTGQRLPHAVVCCSFWLHPGLPEDDWWAGDTWSPCRTLSGCGTPAASEETAAALSSGTENTPWLVLLVNRRQADWDGCRSVCASALKKQPSHSALLGAVFGYEATIPSLYETSATFNEWSLLKWFPKTFDLLSLVAYVCGLCADQPKSDVYLNNRYFCV